jgi:hypothetical protein
MLEQCESIMGEAIKKYDDRRLVMAPLNTGSVVSGTMIVVDLRSDEYVQWIWSHDSQRGSYVSGYNIVPRMDGLLRRVTDESHVAEKVLTEEEIAVTVAQLEQRAESHEVVLGMLQTICTLIKASDAGTSA